MKLDLYYHKILIHWLTVSDSPPVAALFCHCSFKINRTSSLWLCFLFSLFAWQRWWWACTAAAYLLCVVNAWLDWQFLLCAVDDIFQMMMMVMREHMVLGFRASRLHCPPQSNQSTPMGRDCASDSAQCCHLCFFSPELTVWLWLLHLPALKAESTPSGALTVDKSQSGLDCLSRTSRTDFILCIRLHLTTEINIL